MKNKNEKLLITLSENKKEIVKYENILEKYKNTNKEFELKIENLQKDFEKKLYLMKCNNGKIKTNYENKITSLREEY